MDKNNFIFNDPRVVDKYKKDQYITPAEKTAIAAVTQLLPTSSVLDIGCGTGRTTVYLAGLSKEYIGIDYAEGMVDYCKQTFKGENTNFFHCDARYMSQFATGYFDIVLFSFNGIDCVSFEDRVVILSEVARVLKPGGHFIFSAHNARNLDRKYRFRMPRNPFNLMYEFRRLKKTKEINGDIEKYRGKGFFGFYDGAENFSLSIIYTLPELQVEQLQKAGFEQTKLINIKTGSYIDISKLDKYTEPWTYYMTQRSSQI